MTLDGLRKPDVAAEYTVARAFLRRLPRGYQVAQAILFGSRARGNHRADSDLDLAVVLKGQREISSTPNLIWQVSPLTF